ncbi:MAG: SH3 domain-containing protein [Clostridia bacterium]|nr:SH3 domain-containing protein [Clostridia bacterium]
MKCSYCGNELEKGADFCPECGMILGLNESREERKSEAEEPEFRVPEYTPNVFKAIDVEEEASVPAMELEADGSEETVPVTENIPEYVSQVPTEFEDVSSVAPEAEATEAADEEPEAEPQADEAAAEEEIELVAPEYVPAPDMPSEDDLDIRVPEQEITYPEYEKYKNAQAENEVTPTEEEYEEIGTDDIYVDTPKKKNSVLTVFLVIAVFCIIVGGVYAVKNILPSMGGNDETTTTEAQQAGAVSEEDTTEEDTTEAEEYTTEAEEDTTETEEDTTEAEEEDTTEAEDTTLAGDVSEDETTTEEVTEDEEEPTTAPTTTAPSTTKPVTTTRPSTTAPSTTKPATTKPSNTDPYGINDVEVKKPAKYGKAYTLYCTAEGVILRSGPSKSYERVLYLSKGADLTVYAKENGYYYVRSNRYGVYGWVSASYASEGRPETDTTKVTKNTVSPDKKYSKAETKITTNGLNLRKGPGTDYDVITLIPKNYPVKVIGYKSGVSGWAYVTDMTYGYSGWVSTAYIK